MPQQWTTKNGLYLLYNVREPSVSSPDLDDTVSNSGLGATNTWLQVQHIRNNIEDMEDNPNNDANMGNQDGVEEHDTDLDNPSCADTTPNADRGKAITLNLFTTTYNVNQTPI